MNANPQATAYGRIFPPRPDWLARAMVEPIIEPELPIIDTHHHVWRDRGRYMLDEVLADTASGHNVVAIPVDKMGIGYAALWNAFKRIAATASADEKAALFSGTARRVYRLH